MRNTQQDDIIFVRDVKSASDIDEIWEMGSHVSEFRTSENVVTFWPKEVLYSCIGKPDVLCKLIEHSSKVVGFAIVNINHSLRKAELENIFILPAQRSTGLGSILLQEVISDLRRIGIANVVALQIDAVQFYEKNHFSKGERFYWMDLVMDESFSTDKEKEKI